MINRPMPCINFVLHFRHIPPYHDRYRLAKQTGLTDGCAAHCALMPLTSYRMVIYCFRWLNWDVEWILSIILPWVGHRWDQGYLHYWQQFLFTYGKSYELSVRRTFHFQSKFRKAYGFCLVYNQNEDWLRTMGLNRHPPFPNFCS